MLYSCTNHNHSIPSTVGDYPLTVREWRVTIIANSPFTRLMIQVAITQLEPFSTFTMNSK